MKRDISSLGVQKFDVIVIGGGIHGAVSAWQCSARDMKVALVEGADFGSATSANSLKIIHGGFRYLQHLNIKRMRESIISRRIMSRISPENVQALRCAIPNSRSGLRSRFFMRIALFLNDIISFDRNKDILEKCRIPRGEILSLRESREEFPLVDWSDKTGLSIWYDAIALNSERLTLAFVQQAVENGAVAVNYAESQEILLDGDRVRGIKVRDSFTGETFDVEGRSVILAGGPMNERLLGIHRSRKEAGKKWAKAVNVIVRKKILKDTAIGLTGEHEFSDHDAVIKKKGRFFFFVPWRDYTMIGTTYSFASHASSVVKAEKSDIEDIIEEVNAIFPGAEISFKDVSNVHAGLVPAYAQKKKEGEVQLVKETEILDLSDKVVKPVNGIFAINSVKYTTAPFVAFQASEKIAAYLQVAKKGGAASLESLSVTAKLNAPVVDNSTLSSRYGNLSRRVRSYIHSDDSMICEKTEIYAGEITYFLEEEMACKLTDIVFRRSAIGSAERPERATLKKIAERMASHYQWSEERIEKEIAEVENAFDWDK